MFDFIIHTSLRQRLMVLGLSLFLVVYGALTLRQMPVDVFPDLNKPTVTLMTEAGGMAPEEVEQLVSFPIESGMNGMPGVTRVRSVSGVGLSIVYVEFEWGSDIYRNRQQIAERLNLVREQLPEGIVPQMGPISSIMGEILLIALPADPAKVSPMQVREYADWVVRPRLLTIPGIAQVTPIGGEVRQYRVEIDPARLQALGIEREKVDAALRDFGANTSGGFLQAQGREYLIRQVGRTSRMEDLRSVVVGMVEGAVADRGRAATGLPRYRQAAGGDDFMLIVASWVDRHPDGIAGGAREFRAALRDGLPPLRGDGIAGVPSRDPAGEPPRPCP